MKNLLIETKHVAASLLIVCVGFSFIVLMVSN